MEKQSKKGMTTAPKNINDVNGRDTFNTPRYAIDLLIPFIPKDITHVWEAAAGEGRIVKYLKDAGYKVMGTDIRLFGDSIYCNFITDNPPKNIYSQPTAIITNPPYSIKELFIEKAMEYGIPFAMLINADYSGQQIKWIEDYQCEKIIPKRRINYITPDTLDRIHEGESWNEYVLDSPNLKKIKLKEVKIKNPELLELAKNKFKYKYLYEKIDDVPQSLLAKYSASQFHSMWLTWGFNLGRTETFVELTNRQIKENIL